MKKILLFSLALSISLIGFSQKHVYGPESAKTQTAPLLTIDDALNMSNEVALPANKDFWPPEEIAIGYTLYDWQTNIGMQNRIHFFDDGTVGAVFTYGVNQPGFDDRGTGYNFFDGESWVNPTGSTPPNPPLGRIETVRVGWPTYAAYGENGEINGAHSAADGTVYNKRDTKGTGEWIEFTHPGPSGFEGVIFPRIVTGGEDNSIIYSLAYVRDSGFGGGVYEGLDGSYVFSKSVDGGDSWEIENEVIDGISADDGYVAFSHDACEILAEGDNVYILIGDAWSDLVYLKSTDAGETWEKTLVWDSPYSDWTGGITDTFYCVYGQHSLDVDQNGMAHVAFAINRAVSDDGTTHDSYFPGIDGVGYWNENRPTFSDNINSLNPYGHPDSELVDNYSLIGWAQDINNNGEIDINWSDISSYNCGVSSFPQIEVDENNDIYVAFTSIMEDDPPQEEHPSYRRLWMRVSFSGGDTWEGFHNLTADLTHIFHECVYPSMATDSDDHLYMIYQVDANPGTAVQNDHAYEGNYMSFMKIDKADLVNINETSDFLTQTDVSQNFPNPFSKSSVVTVMLKEKADLSLEVINITGQKVYEINVMNAVSGANKLVIDASGFTSGIYFYTVKAGNSSVTKKMIVE